MKIDPSDVYARYDQAVSRPGPADISGRLIRRYAATIDRVLEERRCPLAVAEALRRRLECQGGREHKAAAWLAAQIATGIC